MLNKLLDIPPLSSLNHGLQVLLQTGQQRLYIALDRLADRHCLQGNPHFIGILNVFPGQFPHNTSLIGNIFNKADHFQLPDGFADWRL